MSEIITVAGCFDDQIILDQAWGLEAVYTVFNREKCVTILTQQEGRFSANLPDALVWGPAGYSKTDQGLFLEFMVSSGICFEVGHAAAEIYIAPDLLPQGCIHDRIQAFTPELSIVLQLDSLPPPVDAKPDFKDWPRCGRGSELLAKRADLL